MLAVLVFVSVCAYLKSGEIILFSQESGFYEDSFYLEIAENTGYTFYYTLDGSRPDRTSQKYTEPILIEDASGKDNVYSARKDIALGLDGEGQQEYGWQSPEYPVDKCNVVRVAAYEGDDRIAAEAMEVYFVGFQDKSGYGNIRRISLVTEPESLFDEESGIYVTGNAIRASAQGDNSGGDANFQARGRAWERAAVIDVFEPDGEKVFSSDCGIRIHGGASRGNPQKSFSIYARSEYGGVGRRFTYDLFENGFGPHKFILSSGGNDDRVKVRDYVIQKMAAEAQLDVATMKMFPCALFLNGEYWGVYYATESYNASYISDRYGVTENNVIIVKKSDQVMEIEDGNTADANLYDEMKNFIINNDMQDGDAYQKACEMIDIDSFVDYYAMQIYIGNHDWPEKNEAVWRAREESPINVCADGRWRYMLFDTNHLSVLADPSEDDLTRAIMEDPVFGSLIRNAEVRQKFQERIRQMGDEIFSVENSEEALDEWYDGMSEAVKKSDERYYDIAELNDISYYISSIKWFLEERPEYMEKYMSDCFGE